MNGLGLLLFRFVHQDDDRSFSVRACVCTCGRKQFATLTMSKEVAFINTMGSREEEMAMKVFHDLDRLGLSARIPQEFRFLADKYLEESASNGDTWAPLRFEFFHQYTAILCDFELNVLPTANDWNVLTKMAQDESEPIVFRVDASLARAALKRLEGDVEEAAEWTRETLDLIATATREETCRNIRQSDASSPHHPVTKTVRDVLDTERSLAELVLRDLENPTVGRVPVSNPMFSQDSFVQRTRVGGNKCDFCSKKRNEVAQGSGLFRCSKCKLAYYCSRECQRKQWKAGHRSHCRKQGDIQVGDYVRVRGLVKKREMNRVVGRVVRPAALQGCWEVSVKMASEKAGGLPGGTVLVATDNLAHIRPAK